MDLNLKNDGQLLDEYLQTGDETLFEELVVRHRGMIFSVCLRLTRNEQDTADAAQAVLLTLHQKAKKLRSYTSVSGWLYRVARHVSLRVWESEAIRRAREEASAIAQEIVSNHEDHRFELMELLDHELKKLPEKYRLPIILHHLEERTLEEVAKLLGLSFGTVAVRISRAREMLRKRLIRRGVTVSTVTIGMVLSQNGAAAVPTALLASAYPVSIGIAAKSAAVSKTVFLKAVLFAEEAIKTMLTEKLKVAATMVLMAVGVGIVGLATYQSVASPKINSSMVATHEKADKLQLKQAKGMFTQKAEGMAGPLFVNRKKICDIRSDLCSQAFPGVIHKNLWNARRPQNCNFSFPTQPFTVCYL